MNRPETTLFMLVSVDGKISTGDTDELDFDKDLSKISGVSEGLHQYYDIEKTTDLYSMNTGRVFAKIGLNEKKAFQNAVPVHFIIVDNAPHLTKEGLLHLASKCGGIFLVTVNKNHPVYEIIDGVSNITVLAYEKEVDFADVFSRLKNAGAERVTIQSGGNLNALLIRRGFVNFQN